MTQLPNRHVPEILAKADPKALASSLRQIRLQERQLGDRNDLASGWKSDFATHRVVHQWEAVADQYLALGLSRHAQECLLKGASLAGDTWAPDNSQMSQRPSSSAGWQLLSMRSRNLGRAQERFSMRTGISLGGGDKSHLAAHLAESGLFDAAADVLREVTRRPTENEQNEELAKVMDEMAAVVADHDAQLAQTVEVSLPL